MVQGVFALLAVLVLAVACPTHGQAAPSPAYAGRWAVQSGRFNLLIVEVSDSAPAHATLLRPEHFELYPQGTAIRGISGPYVTFKAVRVTEGGEGLDIKFVNPADPADTDDVKLSLIDGDHGELKLVGTTIPAIPVLRIKADEAPYTQWDAARAYGITDSRPSNAAMAAIFEADQGDRQKRPIDWSVVGKADERRRSEVEALLAAGKLHTGEDYYRAAFIFQHGGAPGDYLLAHTLAMIAAAKRQTGALWIASATLDRYLQSIKQPQIFGTQFSYPEGKPSTQEPFDKRLISDALREELGVGTLAEQEAFRAKAEAAKLAPKSQARASTHP